MCAFMLILVVAVSRIMMYLLGYIGACMSHDGPDSARWGLGAGCGGYM